nr:type II toxin-antitoxin system RelE/ParE family toxin [Ochrobactrum sp. UNC390CL2Tsu3S39]
MHTVIETHSYRRAADEAGMTEDERLRLNNLLSENPTAGDLIQGTGGARKLRFAKPGKGKSGGYRVITYYAADDVPVFIMDVYSKGEKINLSAAEKAELKKILSSVADDWRASVREKVKEMRTAS